MAEQETSTGPFEAIALPYRTGEFEEVADRLGKLADSLTSYPSLNVVTQELRGAAAALARAEGLLASATQTVTGAAPLDRGEPAVVPAVAAATELRAETGSTPALGARGEWRGNVGRQPDFDRVKDGRIRAQFFLAQHPDPDDREKTDWLRCYSLGRHAEALQKKGRLAGAEVLVRGSFQGVRTVPRRDGTTVEQQTIYCYGVRVVKAPKTGPGPTA